MVKLFRICLVIFWAFEQLVNLTHSTDGITRKRPRFPTGVGNALTPTTLHANKNGRATSSGKRKHKFWEKIA
jgi:hypothetical protein